MSKNINRQLIHFFESKLESHSKIASTVKLDDPKADHFIYLIRRVPPLPDLKIILTDQYLFGELDFYSITGLLTQGDIIYIADPNGRASDAALRAAQDNGIFLGRFGEVFGALNLDTPVNYFGILEERKKKALRGG